MKEDFSEKNLQEEELKLNYIYLIMQQKQI